MKAAFIFSLAPRELLLANSSKSKLKVSYGEKAGFTSVRHHPVAREPVVSNLERSRKFVTGGLLLSCTKEKAEGDVASSVIRKLTDINASTTVVTSNN
jgi:hypothetical protein